MYSKELAELKQPIVFCAVKHWHRFYTVTTNTGVFFFLYEYIDTDADFYAFEQNTYGKWKVRET